MPYILYSAKCSVSGKRYIGRTVHTLEHRRKQHERCLYSEKPVRTKFQRALRKYGSEAFNWRILKEYKTLDALIAAEIKCIAHFDTVANGYNITYGGEGFCARHTRKSKRKMAKSQKERFSRIEERLATSEAVKNWIKSNPEQVRRSNRRRAKAVGSDEVRLKVSEGVKQWYEHNQDAVAKMHRKRRKAFRVNNSALKISRTLGGRPIKVYKDGKLFDKFDTQAECCRALSLGSGNVNSCLRGRRTETGGYTFKYASSTS